MGFGGTAMEFFMYVIGIISTLGGLIITIDKLTEIFGSRSKKFSEKQKVKMIEKFKPVFEDIMPQYIDPIKKELAKIKTKEDEQEEELDELEKGEITLLRSQIQAIYERNKGNKTLSYDEKGELDEKFNIYKMLGGNSKTEAMYKEMLGWGSK